MTHLSCDVIRALQGKTLATAESCTGGGIGAALTAVSGSSLVYKGGVISYTNEVKIAALGVDPATLDSCGAVSEAVCRQMAAGVRERLQADIGISVTGLAGPGGDDRGTPVGTVFIGYCDHKDCFCRAYSFSGDREQVRKQAVHAALTLILRQNS